MGMTDLDKTDEVCPFSWDRHKQNRYCPCYIKQAKPANKTEVHS
jgi:hypothetical protein